MSEEFVTIPRALFEAAMEDARTGPSTPGLAIYGVLRMLRSASVATPDLATAVREGVEAKRLLAAIKETCISGRDGRCYAVGDIHALEVDGEICLLDVVAAIRTSTPARDD